MGLGVVLIFWAIAGLVMASASGAFLAGATALLTRRGRRYRRTTICAAALLPFACLGWAGAVFVFQAVINEGLLHRDLGLGDSWYTPLPNGWQVSFIDITDQGAICPAIRGVDTCNGQTGVNGVRLLQVSGPYLFAAADSAWFQHSGEETSAIDQYFAIDTRDGSRVLAPDLTALRAEAEKRGFALTLEPIY